MGRDDEMYEYRATGVLGDKRDTMLHNELHGRPELARAFRRGHTVPNLSFGQLQTFEDGGVSQAISGWRQPEAQSLVFRKPGNSYTRDFVGLNKAAVCNGLSTVKEYNVYRTTHDMPRRLQPCTDGGDLRTCSFQPRRIPLNLTYGMPTRPPTPLWDLIEHKYQDKWIAARRRMEMERMQAEERRHLPVKPNATRTSMLRTYEVPLEPKPLWKLSQFDRRASARIDSFRNRSDLEQARKYDKYDSVARQGPHFHHGIVEPPKC